MEVCGFFITPIVTTSLRAFTAAPEAITMELTCGVLHRARGHENDDDVDEIYKSLFS